VPMPEAAVDEHGPCGRAVREVRRTGEIMVRRSAAPPERHERSSNRLLGRGVRLSHAAEPLRCLSIPLDVERGSSDDHPPR